MASLLTLILVGVTGLILRIFFAISELAIVGVDSTRLKEEADQENPKALRIYRLMENRERLLGSTMTGAAVSIVLTATAIALILAQHFPTLPWIPFAILLGVILALVGEIIPRGWALARGQQVLPWLILPLRFFSFLFLPAFWLVTGANRLIARIFQNPEGLRSFVTREELRYLLEAGANEEIKPLERQMLSRVLDFSEISVEQVMLPWIDARAIRDNATVQEALNLFIEFGHSRLPVYRERIDNVVGVLHAFDVLYVDRTQARVRAHMRPCKYIPENISIDRVLAELQKSRMGMAIVVNEYGGAIGIISVEDILEQIVGDIEDEFDRHTPEIRSLNPTEYLVSARVRIEKLSKTLGMVLPEGNFETVGGMLLTELGRIPEVGETVLYGPLAFTIRKATDRSIKEVHVKIHS